MMTDQNEILRELLDIEETLFDRLNAVIADKDMEDSDVDALSLRYESCVKAILDFKARSKADLEQKCEFIFMMIGRAYNEGELLEAMKTSLLHDFQALAI